MLRRLSLGLLTSAISIASLFAIAFRTDAIAEGDALVHMGVFVSSEAHLDGGFGFVLLERR